MGNMVEDTILIRKSVIDILSSKGMFQFIESSAGLMGDGMDFAEDLRKAESHNKKAIKQ